MRQKVDGVEIEKVATNCISKMSADQRKDICIEIEDKTPEDEEFCVVVFQETKVPQRSPKSPLTVYTAWKVFRDTHSKPVSFKYPVATGLEAEIALPDSTRVSVARQDIPLGSKWLLVEVTETPASELGTADEIIPPKYVLREAAVPTRPPKHLEKIPKQSITVENHLPVNENKENSPVILHISITKNGTPIQSVKGTQLPQVAGSSITFSVNPKLHFGLADDIQEGVTFNHMFRLLAQDTVPLDDFPNGVRVEINKGNVSRNYYFTAHSQLTEARSMPDASNGSGDRTEKLNKPERDENGDTRSLNSDASGLPV